MDILKIEELEQGISLECRECQVGTAQILKWLKSYEYDHKRVSIVYAGAHLKRKIHEQTHEGWTYRGDGSFRAFNMMKEHQIYIFVDESETLESLLWITFHELTHTALHDEKLLIYYFSHKRDDFIMERFNFRNPQAASDFYFADETISLQDEIHENLPEEKFCNDLATRIVGFDYSRPWWRERRKQLGLDVEAENTESA
ncbi:hypothetical protein SD71_16085 [Cohnella kolymensis]|uniref:Phage metallopeptidase domain-containing protein n=1 Tax=Cohnella kolymensis TaxID=1590652 RepID=A0ABR5A269_9BACL|nr:hypothetical protein [Cohnella kolymensis]KIL35146.1 hypothetical protein SD71_16085 [Cohnella kolymensis]